MQDALLGKVQGVEQQLDELARARERGSDAARDLRGIEDRISELTAAKKKLVSEVCGRGGCLAGCTKCGCGAWCVPGVPQGAPSRVRFARVPRHLATAHPAPPAPPPRRCTAPGEGGAEAPARQGDVARPGVLRQRWRAASAGRASVAWRLGGGASGAGPRHGASGHGHRRRGLWGRRSHHAAQWWRLQWWWR